MATKKLTPEVKALRWLVVSCVALAMLVFLAIRVDATTKVVIVCIASLLLLANALVLLAVLRRLSRK